MRKIFLHLFVQFLKVSRVIEGTYKINNDLTVNVDGNVNIPSHYTKIPIRFGYVSGHFGCDFTQITSLEGCPREVGGVFDCRHTMITSLKGAPREVEHFRCGWTNITSLEGGPQVVIGDFVCINTKIASLEGVPQYVGGEFLCETTNMTSNAHGEDI